MVIILEIPRLYIRDVNDKTIATLDRGDYFNDTLTRFLAGKASVLEFTILKKEGDYELFSAGKKISFKYEGEEFWLNMMITDQNEKELTVTALSLNMEFNNETVGPFSAKEWTFKQYFDNMLNMDYSLTLGINEVSDKKISNEWTGTSNLLARLFSLATVFSAELEFVTELNPNGSLKRIVLNVYKEHSDTVQGLGADRRNETFRFGKDIKTVRKSEDASGIYTAIRPYGKDGLSIASIEKEIFDENGKLLFATYKEPRLGFNDPGKIYAPQSRDVFPSTVTGNTDKWTVKETDEMEYSTAEALFGYALGELKKNCVPKTDWEIEGYIKGRIGDTIRVADSGYKPEIYLDARITEQTISFTKPSQNKSTFSNVKELQSQVSTDLLKEMEKIIEANKVYTCTISSTNGVTFKNGEGSTVLTAIVRDSAVEVTDKFSVEWFKDDVLIATGAEITVKASDVDGKSVYKFVAKKADRTVAGMYEVTVTDVSDGKDGNNGRGISGTPETVYGQSKLGTTIPGTWSNTRPDVPAGEYLWTKTITKYTDNTESSVIIPTLMGPKGEQGTAGLGIKNQNVEYAKGTSGTVPPTSGWSTTIPTVNANEYFWTRTTLTYTNNTSTIAYSVGKMGANGSDAKLLYLTATAENIAFNADDTPKTTQEITISAKLQNTTGTATFKAIPYIGNTAQTEITLGGSGNNRTLSPSQWANPNWTLIAITATLDGLSDTLSVTKVKDGAQGIQGIPGKKGDNGKQLYTWLKYADSPTSGMSDSSTNKKYIGLAYNKETITMSTNYSDYSWSLVQGPQGVPGGKGDDGKQLYTWIKYATSDTGAGMSDDSKGKSYIGLAYNKETATESTNPSDYTWALIKGPKGDDGLPAYVHNAWANSPDGTVDFTTVYPGENLLIESEMLYGKYVAWNGNGLSNVASRGATGYIPVSTGDVLSIRANGSYSGYVLIGFAVYLYKELNDTVSDKRLNAAGTAWETPNTSGATSSGSDPIPAIPAGYKYLRISMISNSAVTFDENLFDAMKFKLERGNAKTIYTPSPADDPIGAYMKYMGTCSNHSETAPTDPSAYHWEVDPTYLEHSKVNGNDYENDKDTIYEALEDKANSNELNDLKNSADKLLEDFGTFTGKGGTYEKGLSALEKRAVDLYKELGEGLLKLTFVNTWFKAGEEGLVIGTEGSNIKMLLNNESLSFLDGGKVVAYFTNQNFYINKGAVVKSLQVGSHATISLGEEDTVVQFVGGAIA